MKMSPATLVRLAVLALLIAFLVHPAWFAPLLRPLTENGAPAIYTQNSLLALTIAHLEIVFIASGAASVVAIGGAILVTRPAGAEFLPLSRLIANVGQAFPPVAVLALAVPALGFGAAPTLVALFLYGLLPIFENALAGLTSLPQAVIEAADGMGMTATQRLLRVELPLALPVILGGIRLSVVIGIATATIGSTVAARTLGEVIIAGLLSNNLAFVVQGGLMVSALSVLIFDFMSFVETHVSRGAQARMEQRHE
jgi:osmoprotectant transport system permease protein